METTSLERNVWHPVSFASELKGQPRSVKLLGESIVIWRDANGKVSALKDLCIHRGTALSLGSCSDGEIVCPYHGWRFNREGKCTLIPQLADPCRIPEKARIERYFAQERYGLIWVSLDQPRYELPEVPELESSEWIIVNTGPFTWKSSAARQIENFTDFGHFPFVHPDLLGDPTRTEVPKHEVRTEGNVLYYEIVRPEAPNTDEFPIFSNNTVQNPERRSRYQLHMPYTIVLRLGWGGEKGMIYFFSSQPISDKECSGYCIVARNYNADQPEEVIRKFEDVIFDQDKRVVESQRPEQVPFDLAAELHLKFDAVAVAYRRGMSELGFTHLHHGLWP